MLAAGWISNQDVDMIEANENQYQLMVCSKAWGDYKNINPDCGDEK